MLDLELPASTDKKFICGEDIGLWLRANQPSAILCILTAISDSDRIRRILKSIKPEGFIIKTEMDPQDLSTASETLLKGKSFFSETIKTYRDNNNNNINGYTIDDIDRKILYHLSMGETNSTIANLVYISKRTVEVRKAKLKDVFGITRDSDSNLIKETKKRKLI